jgi:phosphodiesterase/alkaline phosphatase D-like protein
MVAETAVLIGWSTHDAAGNTGVNYGTSRMSLTESVQGTDGADGKNRHARLQGLQPNTRYYFQVMENGSPVGGVGTFKTTAAGEAPVQSKAIIPQK